MSRIGKVPVTLPSGVKVDLAGGSVKVAGPKGKLECAVPPGVKVEVADGKLEVQRLSESRESRSAHGLAQRLIANMVHGVTEGFTQTLEIIGVGYRANMQGNTLDLALGFSHPVRVDAPQGIAFEVPAPNRIVVRGIDKEQVGQVAADIRAIRKPEPYKGKGIRYQGEFVRRKAGKTGKAK